MINFQPTTIDEEVRQNVRMILGTARGTVPMLRGFGLDVSAIDRPVQVQQESLTADVIAQVQTHEPRAAVRGIGWGTSTPEAGDFSARVQIDVLG